MVPFVFVRPVALRGREKVPQVVPECKRRFCRRQRQESRNDGYEPVPTLRTTAPAADRQPHAADAVWLQSQRAPSATPTRSEAQKFAACSSAGQEDSPGTPPASSGSDRRASTLPGSRCL